VLGLKIDKRLFHRPAEWLLVAITWRSLLKQWIQEYVPAVHGVVCVVHGHGPQCHYTDLAMTSSDYTQFPRAVGGLCFIQPLYCNVSLQYIHFTYFINVTIVLRLYLILPVAVCEGERSFTSKCEMCLFVKGVHYSTYQVTQTLNGQQ